MGREHAMCYMYHLCYLQICYMQQTSSVTGFLTGLTIDGDTVYSEQTGGFRLVATGFN